MLNKYEKAPLYLAVEKENVETAQISLINCTPGINFLYKQEEIVKVF